MEKFVSVPRRRLRDMDLDDLVKGRPPATKAAYKARIRAIGKTVKAKIVCRNLIKGLRNVCAEVKRFRGGRSRG